ncbi:hypothetical protein [Deinococcus roseus]|uniref:Uncharacterized protein n=1 Tax=Deinococcus roseus TaxID=392414 RepID=A0ABQ2CZK3_9DEIO|nr:hypothetical protein [Deinococcus roseus]GGJ29242.1 hypothetical protein GCM10008938_14200 [Deinococcus roseus]
MPEVTPHATPQTSGASRFLQLGTEERVPERPFTDPTHNQQDLLLLHEMRDQLLGTLRSGRKQQEILEQGRGYHGIHIFDAVSLSEQPALAFVGFRSILRPDSPADVREELTRIDAHLVEDLRNDPEPAIFAYSSRQLDSLNWLNLVVLKDLSHMGYWQHSQHHQRASQHLSPHYYQGIRLHNGVLDTGIQGTLRLTSTKYYDFSAGRPWLALRSAF